MKLTLMIEGSAGTIAAILANLPADGSATVHAAPQMQPPIGQVEADDGPMNANAPALDVNSMPWDARIHSATKAISANGAWRKRRGVDDATVAAVEGELRAMRPPMVAAPVYAPSPSMPQAEPFPIPQMPMQPRYDPPLLPPVYTAPTVAPAPVHGALDFPGFMQHLTGQMTKRDQGGSPLIHADYLAQVTKEISGAFNFPLNSITDIASNPAMIGYAVQILQRDGRW